MSGDMEQILRGHRAVVCVGTGGVGKTTISAALALAGARLGRRTMVLTIDPARQLARALGVATLGRAGEPVATGGLAPDGLLHAAMLDQKGAWDAFITRHAPSAEVRDTLLQNPFYQKLSTTLAGSTEYMAVEELCRLDESGAYDLIVVDTPPAGRAVDFLRAPERIESLLDPQVARWVGRRGRGALQMVSASVRLVLGLLERTLGTRALREVYAFFLALDALFGDVAARAARARALLYGRQTAFVLVVGPKEPSLAGADELASTLRGLGVPLRAVVANRVHPLEGGAAVAPAAVERALAATGAGPEVQSWLRETWATACAVARTERQRLDAFAAALPSGTAWAEVPELECDAHSLEDLARLASLLRGPR
jgi:anion-transporting  ArsA/GET3 family ATPase